MRIHPHIIPRGRILKNIVETDDMFSGVNIYDDIKEQLKSHLNITNIYDLVNPYEIRRAIIEAGDRTSNVKHMLCTEEGGFEWEDEYSDELATVIERQIIDGTNDPIYSADEAHDIRTMASTILFKDFGYDEYFEHMNLTVYHKIRVASHKDAMMVFITAFSIMFGDIFRARVSELESIDTDKLASYLAHIVITYFTEWPIDMSINYDYDYDKSWYGKMKTGPLATYMMILQKDFESDDFTDAMKYTVAAVLMASVIYVQTFFKERRE